MSVSSEHDLINYVATGRVEAGRRQVRDGRRRFGSVRSAPSRWQARYRDQRRPPAHAPETSPPRPMRPRHLAQVEHDLSRGHWSEPGLGPGRLRGVGCSLGGHDGQPAGQHPGGLPEPAAPLPAAHLRPDAAGRPGIAMAVRAWLTKLRAQGPGAGTRAKSYRLLSQHPGHGHRERHDPPAHHAADPACRDEPAEMRFATVAEVAAWPTPSRRASGRWSWSPPIPACAGGAGRAARPSAWTCCTAGSPWPRAPESPRPARLGPPKTGAGQRTVTCRRSRLRRWPSTWPSMPSRARMGWCSPSPTVARSAPQLHPPGLDPGHPGRRGRRGSLP